MKFSAVLNALATVLVPLLAIPCGAEASGQVVDNLGFKALPRPIHYEMSLAPAGGARAVIVYGKAAPWTQKAAQAVQKAVLEWSGLKLELADDRTVTSDETWLLADAWRKTPLIVLGNAQDNRLMHALGTRFLLQSNRSWPGGDRYLIRSVFEPFAADVNYIVLEASTEAGMNGAAARFAQILKNLPKNPAAAIGIVHEIGGDKDAWLPDNWPWTAPPEYGDPAHRTVAQIALAFKGKPVLPGEDVVVQARAGAAQVQVPGRRRSKADADLFLGAHA